MKLSKRQEELKKKKKKKENDDTPAYHKNYGKYLALNLSHTNKNTH